MMNPAAAFLLVGTPVLALGGWLLQRHYEPWLRRLEKMLDDDDAH